MTKAVSYSGDKMYADIKNKNTELKIQNIEDKSFHKYGKLHDPKDFEDAIKYIETIDVPTSGNVYVAHDDSFQSSMKDVRVYDDIFGKMPLQFGYVNGNNTMLNALEYHKSAEINICVTPLVLMVGSVDDITDDQYDSSKLEVYFVPANTVIEFHPMTLHFSPCKVQDSGFKCGVILPYGTNMEFMKSNFINSFEDKLLFKTNKWLLAHYENEPLLTKGAYPGLTGKNYEIKY